MKLQTLIRVHSNGCHLSSLRTLTQLWNKMCATSVNVLLMLPFKLSCLHFPWSPAHFHSFSSFLSFSFSLVSHFIPNFPSHLLASHSALPPNSSSSLPTAVEGWLLRTSHKDRDMSLPLFIGMHFSRLYLISFTEHLTLERFLIKTG